MNSIVSPSILSCDFLNIEKEISNFSGEKNLWLHLDIMDGHFVPNLTFGIPIIEQISKKTDVPLDAHLMVQNPEFHFNEMKDFGLENITFHYETVKEPLSFINKWRSGYKSIGMSIKPKTLLSEINDDVLMSLDLILVMSVEPGFGGQSFIENSYEKIQELVKRRESLGCHFQIQVDGGVSDKNAAKLREAGAENLVAGQLCV
jgi:ribulose-phosphate 3-epimerase